MENVKSSFPRIARIRKLASKNYVDITYKLDPSPLVIKNYFLGHNLIKHSETSQSIKNRHMPLRSDKLEPQNLKKEVSQILIQLKFSKEASNNSQLSASKNKVLEKRYFSSLKKRYLAQELKPLDIVARSRDNFEDNKLKDKISLKLQQFVKRRTKSIETILSARKSLISVAEKKGPSQLSPCREYRFEKLD